MLLTRIVASPPAHRQIRIALWVFLMLLLGMPTPPVSGGLGPEACVLVVNSDSASSRRIANHYIQLRNIPPQNVIHLTNVPRGNAIAADEFVDRILKPVLEEIGRRKLDRQISCVIYSTDFPQGVKILPWLQKADHKPQKFETPRASLTSLTYLYRHSLAGSQGVISLEANSYARRTAKVVLNVPFVSRDSNQRFTDARNQFEAENWEQAAREFHELFQEQPFQCALAYWECRAHARGGSPEKATQSLLEAIQHGWTFREFAETDPELESLQEYTPFQSALKSIKEPYWELAAPVAFNARITWGPNGFPERLENSASAYLLCTTLGVASGNPAKINTDQEILAYLTRSAEADATHPSGAFFFTETGDVRSRTRQPNVAAARRALDAMGFSSQVIQQRLPPSGAKVLGATIGTANFDWKASGAQLMPGAIGDNLTSFGARFDKHGQTTLSEFLKHGAAGATGTVVEPYAIQNKFPHPMVHAYYARGFSLAEAMYLSLAGPFQTMVVGDPMCQPFAKPPKVLFEGVEVGKTVQETVALQVRVDPGDQPLGVVDFYFDGIKVGALKTGNIKLDTTRHPDGYHELRVVAVSSDRAQAQSHAILPLVFDNQGQQVKLETEVKDGHVVIQANAPGARSIQIVSQGRTLDTIPADNGKARIPVKQLGQGPVVLQGMATFGQQVVAGVPIKLNL